MVVETKKTKKKSGKIELSEEQTKVRDMVVKEGKNVFFTGSAGESPFSFFFRSAALVRTGRVEWASDTE